jgi:hypothetical protein
MSELAAHCANGAALNRAVSLGAYPDFCHAALDETAYTSFRKEDA